ncbi:hypothetical protein [Bradyrhizobium sp. 191]|uniref:hypothetical protein n=1 Tax=Bradyrhizobium sp. 191 TaxID=2782659 RepID=UPI00200017CA|nr:hypothetical protein [Bradyrhizobium sp. 191]UPJ63654.1 hypothetical protein IVB23_27065 [Bradyrhizobium sp. 191]
MQAAIAFAYEQRLVEAERLADVAVKLAWRRHSHVAVDAEILSTVLRLDTSNDLANYRAVTAYIGSQNADLKSHLSVTLTFLDRIWLSNRPPELRELKATGILLEQLTRFRQSDWALVLALVKDQAPPNLRRYIDQWVGGHFLGRHKLPEAERQASGVSHGQRCRTGSATQAQTAFLIDPHKGEERSETW